MTTCSRSRDRPRIYPPAAASLLVAVSLVFGPAAHATSPLLPIQGVVRDNAGALIDSGAFAMAFALYDTGGAETPVWSETWPPGSEACAPGPAPGCVSIQDGVFTALLGTYVPLTAASIVGADQLYLGISVEGEPELPRRPLGVAGRAITALHAELAGSIDCTGCVPATALDFDLCAAAASCGLSGPVSAVDLPPDGLDEVSNGTLSNEFHVALGSDDVPIEVPDYWPPGASATITIADSGVLTTLAVQATIAHENAGELAATLIAPGGETVLLVAPGASPAGSLALTWPPATPAQGDLATLLGVNPSGTWTLNVEDTVFSAGAAGSISEFLIQYDILRDDETAATGDLTVNGTLTVAAGGKLVIDGEADLGAKLICTDPEGLTCIDVYVRETGQSPARTFFGLHGATYDEEQLVCPSGWSLNPQSCVNVGGEGHSTWYAGENCGGSKVLWFIYNGNCYSNTGGHDEDTKYGFYCAEDAAYDSTICSKKSNNGGCVNEQCKQAASGNSYSRRIQKPTTVWHHVARQP